MEPLIIKQQEIVQKLQIQALSDPTNINLANVLKEHVQSLNILGYTFTGSVIGEKLPPDAVEALKAISGVS